LRALLLANLGERAQAAGQPLALEELHEAASAPLPMAVRATGDAGLSGVGFTDADTVATVSVDGTLATWRADGRGQIRTVAFREAASPSSRSAPLKASMSADGRWVAGWNDGEAWLGAGNGSAAFRDAGSIVRKDNTSIDSLTFSRDGSHLAVGYVDGTARVWPFYSSGTTALGPMLVELNAGSAMTIPSLAFDPAGARLAMGSGDGVVYVWDVRTARVLAKLTGHAGAVRTVAFSPDGEWLIAGGENRVATLSRSNGDPRDSLTFAGHDAAVIAAAISRDGRKILTASEDKALIWTLRSTVPDEPSSPRAWDIVGGPRTLVHGGRLVAGAFSPDGSKVITGARDGSARVWWSESQEPRVLGVHGDRVESLAFDSTGTRVISASDDGTARIWALDGRAAPVVLEGHQRGQWVRSAMFKPGDDRQVVTASDDATVRLWTLADSIRMKVVQLTDPVFGAAFDRDGGRVIAAVADNTAKLWNLAAFEQPDPLGDRTASGVVEFSHDDWVMSAAFSPDGSRVVTASKDGTVRVWLARQGGAQPEREFPHSQPVYDVTFSPDGSRVVSSSEDGFARIWFVGGSQSPIGLKHDAAVNKAAFNDQGTMVVTASRDGTAVVWDAVEVASRLTLRAGREAVRAARFTPAGTEVVTGSADGVVRLWRIDAGSLLDYLKTSTTACLDRRERMQFLGETGERAAEEVAECEARSQRRAIREPS
jgi:WD40 repeat protein